MKKRSTRTRQPTISCCILFGTGEFFPIDGVPFADASANPFTTALRMVGARPISGLGSGRPKLLHSYPLGCAPTAHGKVKYLGRPTEWVGAIGREISEMVALIHCDARYLSRGLQEHAEVLLQKTHMARRDELNESARSAANLSPPSARRTRQSG